MNTGSSIWRLTRRNRLWIATLVGLFSTVIYAVSGRAALLLSPRLLRRSQIDESIPLLPWTFWVYVSVYLIYALSCVLQRDLERFGRFLRLYSIAYMLSALFFLVYPTTFPRHLYELSQATLQANTSARALGWFRAADLPTNCLPSMHVVSAVLSTAPFYGRQPRLFLAFSLWTVAIAVTTLTTKQHYAADVAAGFLYGLVLSFFLVRQRPGPAARPD